MSNVFAALSQPSNQRTLQAIARDLLGQEAGSRLTTGSQYQEQLGVGAGTVQKSLRSLSSSGAVVLKSRGHQGTYIVERDLGRLWQLAGLGSVRLLMTPPGADEHHALAAGLREVFQAMGIPMEIAYLRGAERRVREVLAGNAAFTVASGGAARDLDLGELASVELGSDSYYGPDSVVVVSLEGGAAEPATGERLRIGVDRSSYDHAQLTYAEFPDDDRFAYVDCDFTHVPAAVLEGRIDAGIWHQMELLIPLDLVGLATRPLRAESARALRSEISSAVLLADVQNTQLTTVLREIDTATVRATQEALLSDGRGDDELGGYRWAR